MNVTEETDKNCVLVLSWKCKLIWVRKAVLMNYRVCMIIKKHKDQNAERMHNNGLVDELQTKQELPQCPSWTSDVKKQD